MRCSEPGHRVTVANPRVPQAGSLSLGRLALPRALRETYNFESAFRCAFRLHWQLR